MTLTFLTNLVNHHQIPVADELFRFLGNDYVYVAFEPLPDWLCIGGYQEIERPYVLKAYKTAENYAKAVDLANESDVVIIGSASEELVQKRLKASKVTFHYSERWFKNGYHHLLSPSTLRFYYLYHTRYRNKRSYMLCASAYTASDVSKVFAYPDKCYKWGYFTKVLDLDILASLEARRTSTLKILWVARFLNWKHPEQMLQLSEYLNSKGYDYEINMIGGGEMFNKMKLNIERKGMSNKIHLLGNMPNEQVQEVMRYHHIFCFTSDRNEGWGAVLNEAMSNGCCPVASDMIGATPYLIKNKENGLIYQSGSLKSLFNAIEYLILHPKEREQMAINAYNTLRNVWSPQIAAERLIKLCKSKCEGVDYNITDGPCSKAH